MIRQRHKEWRIFLSSWKLVDTPRQDLHFRGRNLGCVSCSWPGQMVHSSGTPLKCHYCVQIQPKAKGLEPFPFVLHLKEFRENKTISGPFFFFCFKFLNRKNSNNKNTDLYGNHSRHDRIRRHFILTFLWAIHRHSAGEETERMVEWPAPVDTGSEWLSWEERSKGM